MNTHLKLLGVAILWGASWPWGRMVAQALPPITAAAMRFALAALGLLIWLGCSKKGWHTVRALSTRQWLGLAVAAACGVFGYALFFMLGLQYVSASRGAVVITMNPALTLLLAAWLFKERLNAAIILGMLLAIGGALTAITQGQVLQFFAGGFKSGEVLLLGCVICWAAYTLIGRALLQELLARCALLAECKAVQSGDIWCTTPSFFQQSMALADFMLDLHAVFTEATADPDTLHFLTRIT